jgi:CubicO group peptidase (beta-lactamase class C family)
MKNKCLALLLFVAFVAVGATTRIAIAQEAKLTSEQQTQIESAISKFMASSRAPGISVAVVEDGQLVWSSGFGFADLENHVAAMSATLYRLGSISKPITATGAMQLWEQKKLLLSSDAGQKKQ